jgi:tRNA(Ile)-lysidine synthase
MRQIERRPPAPAPRPAARLRLERRILHTLRERALTPPGSRGLVCVSGGPDSLALLHLLHAAAGPLALRLDVLHFDHGLRPEAATEADWVARQAAALGLPCHILRATHLAQRATGVQAAARAWRRAEALRLATQWDAQWVASGHQRDDQLETILLKLLRGAHISRLAGMDWRQGRFVRPLLETSRAELTDYLRRRGQEWLEDPSNRRPAYKRNRVRHELLPLLDALAGGAAAQRLTALETQSAQVAELLRFVQAAHPVPQSPPEVRTHWIDAAALAALPHAVAGATLHAFVVARLPGTLPASQLEQALHLLAVGAPQWSLDLSQRRRLRRRGARLLLECQPEARTGAAGEGAWHVVDGRRIQAPAGWRVSPATPSGDAPDGETTLALHNLPPGAELQVRAPQPGDRFQPAWKARPVLLARFLRDQHVAPWERERMPLVLWEGRVIAVGTGHVGAAHAAPAGPEAALRLTIRPV